MLTILFVGTLEAAIDPLENATIKSCTFRDAPKVATGLLNLDLIHISNQLAIPDWDVEECCSLLAVVLRPDPKRTGVVIEDDALVTLLYHIFNEEGIRTFCSDLPGVMALYRNGLRRRNIAA